MRTSLKTKTLPELVASANALNNDTKSLDTSMQNLVYENYNKFISATDTIRQMKESVSSMDDRMLSLVKGMADIMETSAVINSALHDNRSKVEKLVGVRRLLKKLEFLFELPVRLNRSIELEAYSQAVKYYNMASGVLRKYDAVPSLHAIRVEADEIMGRLRDSLRKSLKDRTPADSGLKVIECIRLLVSLREPRPGLRDAYLSWQRARLKDALAALQRGLKTATGLDDPTAFMSWLNDGFLDAFVSMADTYCSLFEDTCGDGMEGQEERRIAHLQLVAVSKELFVEYFDMVKRRLSFPQAPPPAPSGDDAPPPPPRFASLVQALQKLLHDVRTAGQCVREARLGDLTAEAVEAVIRLQVDGLFGELRAKVKQLIIDTVEDHRSVEPSRHMELGSAVRQLGVTLHLYFDDVLESARPLVLAGACVVVMLVVWWTCCVL